MMYTGEERPVYVVWELCCRGVMPSCCGDCIDTSGGFLSVPEVERLPARMGKGKILRLFCKNI